MKLKRREFLMLSGSLAISAGLASCAPFYARLAEESQAFSNWSRLEDEPQGWVFHALSRMTFGPRLTERVRATEIGLGAWIEEQLAPDAIDDAKCNLRLRGLDTLGMQANELVDWSDKIFDNQDRKSVPEQLRQATLIRQVYSRRQLYEVMVDFWSDHFNVSLDKGDCWFLKTVDDREVIRAHALGNFRDLLWASAHSPAMLVYLDNQSSQKGMPNENYARELMELHTLGVDGGYTQKDVMELARCLTGWTVKEHFWRGEFTFNPQRHDRQPKQVLGLHIEPAGQAEAESVLDQLAHHPSTARFIATKLARRFIADQPPPEIVDNAEETFTKTDGDLKAVVRTILETGLGLAQPKFKRPSRFIVSTLRMLEVQSEDGKVLAEYLARMGQPYFGWPTPDGFPDHSEAWLGNLMPRWQFAFDLALNRIPGISFDLQTLVDVSGGFNMEEFLDQLSRLLLGRLMLQPSREALLNTLRSLDKQSWEASAAITAGLVASPDYQYY